MVAWPAQGVLEHQSLFVSTFQLVDYESMMEVPAGHFIGAAGQRSKTQMVRNCASTQ